VTDSTGRARLEERGVRSAEAASSRQQYVSPVDVFCGMGLLASNQLESWPRGRIDFLERVIQGNLSKISTAMAAFRSWALSKRLIPSETVSMRRTRNGKMPLQFSKSKDPAIEKHYRPHNVSPALSKRKQKSVEEKLGRAPEPPCLSSAAQLPMLGMRRGDRSRILLIDRCRPAALP
jgi:hypothetical protein